MTIALIILLIKLIKKRLSNDEIRGRLGIERGTELDKDFIRLSRVFRRNLRIE